MWSNPSEYSDQISNWKTWKVHNFTSAPPNGIGWNDNHENVHPSLSRGIIVSNIWENLFFWVCFSGYTFAEQRKVSHFEFFDSLVGRTSQKKLQG